ncbi:MAG: Serine/threonine-protein kinase PknD, partial [Verrucomicrobiota bacterium]
ENIMIGEHGEVQVLDWGIAKVLGHRGPPGERGTGDEISSERHDSDSGYGYRTLDGEILGSPLYMSPEQSRGGIELDGRSDIYSLGAILYRLISLKHYIDMQGTRRAIMSAKIKGEHIPLMHWDGRQELPLRHLPGGRIPPGLAAVVEKCLKPKREDRYTDLPALISDLEAWRAGFAPRAEQAGFLRQAGLLVRRHRALSGTLAAASAMLLLTGALSMKRIVAARDDARQQAEEARRARAVAEERGATISSHNRDLSISHAGSLLGQGRHDEALAMLEQLPSAQRTGEWHFLRGLTQRDFRVHDEAGFRAEALRFSPDGMVYGLCGRGLLRFHDTLSGRLVAELKQVPEGHFRLHFSADGSRFACSGTGRSVVYDQASLRAIADFSHEELGPETVLDRSGEYMLSLPADGASSPLLWNIKSRRYAGHVPAGGPRGKILSASFLDDSEKILITREDGSGIWNWPADSYSGEYFNGSRQRLHTATPDTGRLFCADLDNQLTMQDQRSGSQLLSFCQTESAPSLLRVSSDGSQCLAASSSLRLHLWDQGSNTAIVANRLRQMRGFDATPDLGLMAVIDLEGRTHLSRIRDFIHGEQGPHLYQDAAPLFPKLVASDASGSLLVQHAAAWKEVRICEARELGVLRRIAVSAPVEALALSPDGRSLALLSGGGTQVAIHDCASGEIKLRLPPSSRQSQCRGLLSFSPDSRRLICRYQGRPSVIEAASGKVLVSLDRSVVEAVFTGADGSFAARHGKGELHLHRPDGTVAQRRHLPEGTSVIAGDASRDLLACGAEDGLITMQSLSDGKPLGRFASEAGSAISCLKFEGERLIAGCLAGSLCFYDLKAGRTTLLIPGHGDGLNSLATCGRRLFTGSQNSIRYWGEASPPGPACLIRPEVPGFDPAPENATERRLSAKRPWLVKDGDQWLVLGLPPQTRLRVHPEGGDPRLNEPSLRPGQAVPSGSRFALLASDNPGLITAREILFGGEVMKKR